MSDRTPWYEQYKVDVPEGTSGPWMVKKFEVNKEAASFERLRAAFSGGRYVPEGTYTGLYRGRTVIMSDTPDEISDHTGFIRRASGRVLIHGLGLGMVAAACLKKEEVTSVTVVDLSPDVIKLVGPTLDGLAASLGKELVIIEGDCFTWKPKKGERWNAVWHDVWDDLCTDNLKEMATLHRRFGRRCDFQDSWGRGMLKRRRDQESRMGW